MVRKLILLVPLFLLAALALTPPACASNSYYDGYTEDGYVFRSGYWWKAGYAYTRQKEYTGEYERVYRDGYWVNARLYRWCYYLVKTDAAPAYVAPTPTVPTYTDPNWRSKLLDIAKQRDTIEGQRRLRADDHQAYQETLRGLGLEGNFRWNGYGAPALYAGYGGNVALGTFGAQGQTVYGYGTTSYQQTAQMYGYGQTDMNALYQQYFQGVKAAQQLAGEVHAGATDVVKLTGEQAARLAEIRENGEAARKVLEGIKPQPRATITTQQTTTRPMLPATDDGADPAPTPVQVRRLSAGDATRQAACLSCHSGATAKGGLDLSRFAGLSVEQRDKMASRLYHSDPAKRMPPDGTALTPTQRQAIMTP